MRGHPTAAPNVRVLGSLERGAQTADGTRRPPVVAVVAAAVILIPLPRRHRELAHRLHRERAQLTGGLAPPPAVHLPHTLGVELGRLWAVAHRQLARGRGAVHGPERVAEGGDGPHLGAAADVTATPACPVASGGNLGRGLGLGLGRHRRSWHGRRGQQGRWVFQGWWLATVLTAMFAPVVIAIVVIVIVIIVVLVVGLFFCTGYAHFLVGAAVGALVVVVVVLVVAEATVILAAAGRTVVAVVIVTAIVAAISPVVTVANTAIASSTIPTTTTTIATTTSRACTCTCTCTCIAACVANGGATLATACGTTRSCPTPRARSQSAVARLCGRRSRAGSLGARAPM